MNRNRFLALFLLATFALFISGCGDSHYAKVDGTWKWVTWDEGHGTRYWELENVDSETFEVINEIYAKDRNHVYIKEFLIRGANPSSFRLLEFPFSTDEKTLYCGNVPMTGADIESFKVTKPEGRLHECVKPALKKMLSKADYKALPDGGYIYSDSQAYDQRYRYIGPKKFVKKKCCR